LQWEHCKLDHGKIVFPVYCGYIMELADANAAAGPGAPKDARDSEYAGLPSDMRRVKDGKFIPVIAGLPPSYTVVPHQIVTSYSTNGAVFYYKLSFLQKMASFKRSCRVDPPLAPCMVGTNTCPGPLL